jgi:ubiquinone/menaquinone biosynthesis C-methylase UbiE
VGCGPAILASQVGADYVGVDIRMAMLVRSDQARVVCADAAALPFADGQFDTVVSTAFLGLLEPGERHAIL